MNFNHEENIPFKYARRVVARVETEAGLDLSAALLAAGLAQPYDGGPRPVWCD